MSDQQYQGRIQGRKGVGSPKNKKGHKHVRKEASAGGARDFFTINKMLDKPFMSI